MKQLISSHAPLSQTSHPLPIAPQLQPPGAGLPLIETWIGRCLFQLKCLTGSTESFSAEFHQHQSHIHTLLRSCPLELRSQRVLIKRLRGLEDSSRYWSFWMTLDHLRITNMAFANIIQQLSRGNMPAGKASTAAVKPSPEVTHSIEAQFDRSCEGVLDVVAKVQSLHTPVRYTHPWFGPLNAYQWHALSATHMGIHARQLQCILQALRNPA